MSRSLHLILALALLLFSWAELAHHLDADAHQSGQACEVCLLAAHLGHGAQPGSGLPLPAVAAGMETLPVTNTAPFPQPFRHTLGQRGPPHSST